VAKNFLKFLKYFFFQPTCKKFILWSIFENFCWNITHTSLLRNVDHFLDFTLVVRIDLVNTGLKFWFCVSDQEEVFSECCTGWKKIKMTTKFGLHKIQICSSWIPNLELLACRNGLFASGWTKKTFPVLN